VLLAACLVVGVVWFSRGIPSVSASIALGLVSGGAFGNLADRIFRHDGGAVVDFIHVGVWPTFNVADSAIVCGTALLVVVFLRADHALEPRGSGEHGG
jgi:signal peptidase II